MKRILFSLALVALLFPATERSNAGGSVSLNFFYDNLEGGSWIDVADYGYCWQPEIAVNDANWRPYSDGYWAYTDVGWTWVSYEPFGWATYHYGRWARLADYGWVWVPGTEWGPAWVSWRTGGDYVGWAPLPPRRRGYREPIYEGRPITGYVDIEFDIGPAYYNFCDVRYIGEPVLRHRIFAPTQNITYINQTVNVTNITYNNNVVYNYGPDYNYLSAYSTRPIQRLRLRRETNIDPLAAVRANAVTKVQGDQLVVAAPVRVERPPETVAPRVVKAKVEQPRVETGWVGVANPDVKEQLLEKMRKEDRKAIPPPKIEPVNPAALAGASPPSAVPSPAAITEADAPAGAAPSPAGSAPTALPPGQQDKDAARRAAIEQRLREKENRKGQSDAATAALPGAPPTSPAAPQPVPGTSPAGVADAAASPAPEGAGAAQPAKIDKDAARRAAIEQRLRAGEKKKGERDAAPPAPSSGEASAAAESVPPQPSTPATEEASKDQKKGARGARGVVGPGMPTRQNEVQEQVSPPNFPPASNDGRAVNKHRFPDAAGQGQAEAMDAAREQQKEAARAAKMQQQAEAQRERQQQIEQMQEQAESKRAAREQMQQQAEAQRAARQQQMERIQEQAESKRAAREQMQQQAEAQRAARQEQMQQMQQQAESQRAARQQQMQQMQQAREAARQQQQQAPQQQDGGDRERKPKKGKEEGEPEQ